MTSQLDMFHQPDPVEERRKMLAERAKLFSIGQRVRLTMSMIADYSAGDTGVILHQESIGSFAVRLDRQGSDVEWVTLYADEIEPEVTND